MRKARASSRTAIVDFISNPPDADCVLDAGRQSRLVPVADSEDEDSDVPTRAG